MCVDAQTWVELMIGSAQWIISMACKHIRRQAPSIVYTRGLQTTARGPNPAREAILSGPQSYFIQPQRHLVNNEKIIYWRKFVDLVHYNISGNMRKMSGPQTAVHELMWPSNKKVWSPLVYTHCDSDCFKLGINHSSQVIPIKVILTLAAEMLDFVETSQRRCALKIDQLSHCEGRFVQSRVASLCFVSNFQQISTSLSVSSETQHDARIRSKAGSLQENLMLNKFLVVLVAVNNVMAGTLCLCGKCCNL